MTPGGETPGGEPYHSCRPHEQSSPIAIFRHCRSEQVVMNERVGLLELIEELDVPQSVFDSFRHLPY